MKKHIHFVIFVAGSIISGLLYGARRKLISTASILIGCRVIACFLSNLFSSGRMLIERRS